MTRERTTDDRDEKRMRERLDQDMRKDDERQRSEEAASHLAGRPLSPSSRHRSPHGLAPVPFAIPLTSPRRDSDRFHSALRAGFAGETGPAARGEKSEGTNPVSDRSLPTLRLPSCLPFITPTSCLTPSRSGSRRRSEGMRDTKEE